MAARPRPELVDLAEALAGWLAPILPLGEEAVPAPAAPGRVLARPMLAWRPLPAHARSAVDGYAVRAGDLAADVPLTIAPERVWAGTEPPALEPGMAMFVATGAAAPAGADAVVPIELTILAEGVASGVLRVARPVAVGANLRARGEDLAAGEEALRAGERVDADRLPLVLAAAGGRAVLVAARPRVTILPCGDELCAPGRAPAGVEVMEVVGSALALRAREDGAVVELAAPVPDRLELLADAVASAAARCDLVVTVGGASIGERDHAAAALVQAGGSLRFHGLRLRPGTPALGGRLGAAAVLGLPGNPVAALTVWELVGRAALFRLSGRAAPAPFEAVLERPCDKRSVREDRYLRGAVWAEGGRLRARIWDGQNAGMLLPLARTNALVLYPRGVSRLEEGAPVEVRLTAALAAARPAWPGA